MRLAAAIAMLCLALTLRAQEADSVVTVRLAGGVQFDLVWVEGGSFTMGNNQAKGVKYSFQAARPEHKVSVGSFYIARHEVTQALWTAVMGGNPSKFSGSDSLPVDCVSWDEARQFALLLSQMTGHRFRLPTEAEWEYAARGGRRSRRNPFAGSDRKGLDASAWYCVNSQGSTHPVGQLQPNELGLYDMSGNVAEWCLDWMSEYSPEAQDNPRGPRQGEHRVLRGGHYNSTSSACTVYDRGWYIPSGKYEYYGFRIIMEPDHED
ncbi:MAG: formylglycine-generating enzyme family protein [Bacteroidales bacterium]|nr:formylglycine-generating enzyme family protein [Bacteroidales bacterium]